MDNNIIESIERAIPYLSAKQKRIAVAILQDPLSATFMSVQQLSEKIKVSPATIVRFAQEITGTGYPELQASLQKYIQAESNPIKRMKLNSGFDSKDEEYYSLVHDTFLNNMERAFTIDSIRNLNKACNLLFSANTIFTLGSRASYCLAYFLGQHLNRALGNSFIVADDDKLPDCLRRSSEGDVAIYFCVPRYSRRLVKACQTMHEKGVRVISVNDSPSSPFVKYSDISLFAPCTSNDFHNSLLAPMMLADLLISMIIKQNPDKTLNALNEYEQYFSTLDQFYTD